MYQFHILCVYDYMLKSPVQEHLSKLKVVFIWLLAMLQLALKPLT